MRRTVALWKRILVYVLLFSMVLTQGSITALAKEGAFVPKMTVSDAEETVSEEVTTDVTEQESVEQETTTEEMTEETIEETAEETTGETSEETIEETTEEATEGAPEEPAKMELVADDMDITVKVEADSAGILPDDTYVTAVQVPVMGEEGEIAPIDSTEDVLYEAMKADSVAVLSVDDVASSAVTKEENAIAEAVVKEIAEDAATVDPAMMISVPLNITLYSGDKEVQPNGMVKVSIQIPASMEPGTVEVYHVEEDGNTTCMNGWVENGYYVFETNHFSVYTITGKSKVTESYVSLGTSAGQTLYGGNVYVVTSSRTISASGSNHGLIVSGSGSANPAVLFIPEGVTLTVKGGTGSGGGVTTSGAGGGGAGIYLPSGQYLYVRGYGTLYAYGGSGGKARNGASGSDGDVIDGKEDSQDRYCGGSGGSGGGGAGGGGAGIGTGGASGGSGGSGGSQRGYYRCEKDTWYAGYDGSSGSTGYNSGAAGDLYILDGMSVYAYGGSYGSYGTGGSRGYGDSHKWNNTYYGGGGGGGGGGGYGGGGASIGSGGAGGGGGGGAGGGGTERNDTYPQGGGGSGGKNGGGNGGGTQTTTEDSRGGYGKSGGSVGSSGSGGRVYVSTSAYCNALSYGSGSTGYGKVASRTSLGVDKNSVVRYTFNPNKPEDLIAPNDVNYTKYIDFVYYDMYTSEIPSAVASLPGYTFKGWFTEPEAGTMIIDPNGKLVAGISGYTDTASRILTKDTDVDVYAQWERNEYSFVLPESKKVNGLEAELSIVTTEGNSTINTQPYMTPMTAMVSVEGEVKENAFHEIIISGVSGTGKSHVDFAEDSGLTSDNSTTTRVAVTKGFSEEAIDALENTFTFNMPDVSTKNKETWSDIALTHNAYYVRITGAAVQGKELTAHIENDDNVRVRNSQYYGEETEVADASTVDVPVIYTWYRGNKIIGTGPKYLIDDDDIGKTITVKANGVGSNYTGTIESTPTDAVVANQPTTDKPFRYIYGNGSQIKIDEYEDDKTTVYYFNDTEDTWIEVQYTDGSGRKQPLREVTGGDLSEWTIVGGYKETNYVGNTSIVMNDGIVKAIYGGNQDAFAEGNTQVTVNGGTIAEDVYGGGQYDAAEIKGSTNVIIAGGQVLGNVYGGGYSGRIDGNANVTLKGGSVLGNVYAGGNTATKVEVGGEQIEKLPSIVEGETNVLLAGSPDVTTGGIVMSSVKHSSDEESILTISGLLDKNAKVNLIYENQIGKGEKIAYSSNVNYLTEYTGKLNAADKIAEGCHMVTDGNYIVLSDEYQVTFDFFGGKNGTVSYKVQYGTEFRDRIKIPIMEGYAFNGYYAEKTYEHMYYDANGSLENGIGNFEEKEDITLYAKWEQILEWKEKPESLMLADNEIGTTDKVFKADTTIDDVTYNWYYKDAEEWTLIDDATEAEIGVKSIADACAWDGDTYQAGTYTLKVEAVAEADKKIETTFKLFVYEGVVTRIEADLSEGIYTEAQTVSIRTPGDVTKEITVEVTCDGEAVAGSPIVQEGEVVIDLTLADGDESNVYSIIAHTDDNAITREYTIKAGVINVDCSDDRTVGYGTKVVLEAVADAEYANALSYQWKQYDSAETNATQVAEPVVELSKTSELTLNNLKPGTYYFGCALTVKSQDNYLYFDNDTKETETRIIKVTVNTLGKVARPYPVTSSESDAPGNYKEKTSVQFDVDTENADIYYAFVPITAGNLDPTEPMDETEWMLYSKGTNVPVESSGRLFLKAKKDGYTDSNTFSGDYKILALEIQEMGNALGKDCTYTEGESDDRLQHGRITSDDYIYVCVNDIGVPNATIYDSWYYGTSQDSLSRQAGSGIKTIENAGEDNQRTVCKLPIPKNLQPGEYFFVCEVASSSGAYAIRSEVMRVDIIPLAEKPVLAEGVSEPGTYYEGMEIRLETKTDGAVIKYSVNNGPEKVYTDNIEIPSTPDETSITAWAQKEGYGDSEKAVFKYTVKAGELEFAENCAWKDGEAQQVYNQVEGTLGVSAKYAKGSNDMVFTWYKSPVNSVSEEAEVVKTQSVSGNCPVDEEQISKYEIPTDLTAGNHYFYCVVSSSEESIETLVSDVVKLTVKKADITPTLSMEDCMLDGQTPEPVVTGNVGEAAIEYAYKRAEDGDETYKNGITPSLFASEEDNDVSQAKPGKYVLRATISETENYNGSVVYAEYEIKDWILRVGDSEYFISADEAFAKAKDLAGGVITVRGEAVLYETIDIGTGMVVEEETPENGTGEEEEEGLIAENSEEGEGTEDGDETGDDGPSVVIKEGPIKVEVNIQNGGKITIANGVELTGGTFTGSGTVLNQGTMIKAVLDTSVINSGKILDSTIGMAESTDETAVVTGGVLGGNIENHGTIKALSIEKNAVVTGGKISGEVVSAGTVIDALVLTDSELIGGYVKNTLTNDGVLKGATILPSTTVTGGTVDSVINEGTVKNATIVRQLANTHTGYIDGCILSETAEVSGGRVFGNNTSKGKLSGAVITAGACVDGGAFLQNTVNNGKISNASLEGTVTNTDMLENVTVQGELYNRGSMVGNNSCEGIIHNEASITIKANETFSISGQLNNKGTIKNEGTLAGNGNLVNDGVIENENGSFSVATVDNTNGKFNKGTVGKQTTLTGGEVTAPLTNNGILKDIHLTSVDGLVNAAEGKIYYPVCKESLGDVENHGQILFKVTFDANGHGQAPEPMDALLNEKIPPLGTMSESGYVFAGWYKEANAEHKWDAESDVVTGNVTLYAKWLKEGCYVVRYYGNGGTCTVKDNTNYLAGSQVQVIFDNIPTRAGYVFAGWALNSDAKYADYAADGVRSFTMPQDDVALYAVWYEEGTVNADKPQIVKQPMDVFVRQSETPEGMSVEATVHDGGTLTYQWYVSESRSYEDAQILENATETYYVPNTDSTGYKYYFVEITNTNEAADGMKTVKVYSDIVSVYVYSQNATGATVTFEPNVDGESDLPVRKYQNVETGSLILEPVRLVRENYAFTGWYKDSACTNKWDFENEVVTEDITLYAGWSQYVYVAYSANGGTFETAPSVERIPYGAKAPKPGKDIIVKSMNLEITGWFSDPECTVLWDFENDIVTEDITLYAGWGHAAGESTEPEMSVSGIRDYDYTGKAIKPVVVVRDGDKILELNKDYTIQYKNNVKVSNRVENNGLMVSEDGTHFYSQQFSERNPIIIIKGKGNYTSHISMNFNICPLSLGVKDTTKLAPEVTADIADVYVTNGKQNVKPSVKIQYGKTKLNKKDYSLDIVVVNASKDGMEIPAGTKYTNGQIPKGTFGTFCLKVQGVGNYTDGFVKYIEVQSEGNSIQKANIKVSDISYLGRDITVDDVSLTVKLGKKGLVRGQDYDIIFGEGYQAAGKKTNPGVYPIYVIGKGEYVGTRMATVKVKSLSLKTAEITFANSQVVYDGTNHGANIKKVTYKVKNKEAATYFGVKIGEVVELKQNIDFVVTVKGGVNAGKTTVVLKGIGGFEGSKSGSYTITRVNLRSDAINGERNLGTVDYTVGGARPDVVLMHGDKKLISGVDYKLSYNNNKTPGAKATVTVTGMKNYQGTLKDFYFTVGKADISVVGVTAYAEDVTMSAKKGFYKAKVTLTNAAGKKLAANKDYDAKNLQYYFVNEDGTTGELVNNDSVLKVGDTLRVVIQGKGGYTNSVSADFRIVETLVKKASFKIASQTYSGNAVELNEKAFIKAEYKGMELVYGRDYVIVPDSYENNLKKGTAKVVLEGRGQFGGRKTVTFKIVSKEMKWWSDN